MSTVLIETIPKVEKNKQPSNTNLRQDETVTVTQTDQDVSAAQNFDPKLTVKTSVTRYKLVSLIIQQTKKQYSSSLKKKFTAAKHKLLRG
jgi:hypothetical protein